MCTQIVQEPSGAGLEAATATLKLLADRTRLHIVWALLHGEHSVDQLSRDELDVITKAAERISAALAEVAEVTPQ